ncbi:cytosolic arginine sensor for mTORC1 subunit 1-like [Xenia sp. Carnegie-2017]|uniref:cytosolic arginine sensor for mTORC1 subunit 1-like n=1 Tax=Xenia sp. Carnegie-2017 TaxID=2897299 RepID=UPI001F0474CF|nr:cytosolic arginine sensor for mTORC1 subunit 1-like [Xenia sp. Carnegie-2017]XP_046840083.1 cytosolic arginine sensor for mTORC1 subunit 1-like [Xenia sp. Carnegie-2017]XP_046840084.1 cytosolic arginine sensor for mTORC1 subunit 1-like [Xenia sp. Carnegie-2017]XP_046840085.1 cytosolic arginine sensor for mTORC1 subunit 1-like [Xenia sp. Carnegie-2017]
MAKENGMSINGVDTRLELHILEYTLRMATISKDAISKYTHYLIKIALLPKSRPGFFSFTKSNEDYSLTLEETAFQELPKGPGLSCSKCLWNVLTVSPGVMDCAGNTMGISKIVNSIILPLANNGVSLFCMSTYQGDFILVKQQELMAAICCLNGKFRIFDETGFVDLSSDLDHSNAILNRLNSDSRSHPLVHSIVSPLNKFHVISLNSQYFTSLIPTLIDLMFYSSSRRPPSEGYETFFHFSYVDGDLSVVLDDNDLARFPSHYFYTSSFREQWRIIKIGEYPLGYDECGIVAQIAEPLVEAKITTFYISSCHLGNTLIPEEDIDKALDILNERRTRHNHIESA